MGAKGKKERRSEKKLAALAIARSKPRPGARKPTEEQQRLRDEAVARLHGLLPDSTYWLEQAVSRSAKDALGQPLRLPLEDRVKQSLEVLDRCGIGKSSRLEVDAVPFPTTLLILTPEGDG